MYHSRSFVQIFNSPGNLCNDMATEILTEIRQSNYLMEQLAARAKLKDDVVELLRLGEVNEPDDVRVIELPHYLDFFQNIRTLKARSS